MEYKDIIQKKDDYVRSQKMRGKHYDCVNQMLVLYDQSVRLDFQNDMLKRLKNVIGPHIAKIKKTKTEPVNQQELDDALISEIFNYVSNKDTFDTAKHIIESLTSVDSIKLSGLTANRISENKAKFPSIREELQALSCQIGNILDKNVPINKDTVLFVSGDNKTKDSSLLGHHELCRKTQIVNFTEGTTVAGNRGYYLVGLGVKLNRALMSYALNFLDKESYELYETPHMMTQQSLEGVAQLDDFQESLYKCSSDTDSKYLIATSEQPLTAMYRNKVIRTKNLPIKIGGLSHCYRKETGSHGKDTLGIFRVHQFEKVEQFCLTSSDTSAQVFNDMIDVSKKFYESLKLSYRIINVHAEDLNNAAHIKHDLEGYFPAAENYKELVSCTNCTDYMSKKIHCKDDKGNCVHMLNATLCANTRTLCCILETYQTDTGITVPDVLVPYMGGVTHIPFKDDK